MGLVSHDNIELMQVVEIHQKTMNLNYLQCGEMLENVKYIFVSSKRFDM